MKLQIFVSNCFLLTDKLVTLLQKINSKIWLCYTTLKYPNLIVGKNLVINGTPRFEIFGKALIKDNNTFISSTRYNPVGIMKPCNIYVAPKGELTIGLNGGFSGVTIVCWERIKIGDYCGFGGNVSIWDTDFHGIKHDKRVIEDAIKTAPIHIGNHVWIGANSLIMKGVTIGDRSVIGAGSIITKDIPEDEIWAGNPAHFIKKII